MKKTTTCCCWLKKCLEFLFSKSSKTKKNIHLSVICVCVCCMCIAYLFQDQKKKFFHGNSTHNTHFNLSWKYDDDVNTMGTRTNEQKKIKKNLEIHQHHHHQWIVFAAPLNYYYHTHTRTSSIHWIASMKKKKIESNSLILHMVKKKTTYHIWCREKKTILHIRLRIFFFLSLSLCLCVLFVIIFIIIIVVELGDHPYESFHLDGFRGQSRC